ncbi:MAG TPA: right-handed parallel beta-helix repeat-containing protein, partial [Methylomirabilota bacterium]|nr:right-handed parallel beta-helix repeat-containing protein [Methylomirabilota bacterium]
LETALIKVGEPFKLEILDVSPPAVAPGQVVNIVLRGAPYALTNPENAVLFGLLSEGRFYEGTVLAVNSLDAQREQLTVQTPAELVALAEGAYDLRIIAQGRIANRQFQLAIPPTVQGMTEREGFAAHPDFLGGAFPGTPVTITGVGFSATDQFVFGGGVEAANKSGASGNVTVRVPQGAQSGTIQIIRQVATNDVRRGGTPFFRVLGPPVIQSMTPDRGPVGTPILFQMANLGAIDEFVYVQFATLPPAPLQFGEFFGEQVALSVPAALAPTNGQAQTILIRFITPAGRAERSFVVEPGRSPGARIEVGGTSVINLQRALAFAAGTASPLDDRDVIETSPGVFESLDPPYEEGDFVFPDRGWNASPRWPVGAAFADFMVLNEDAPGPVTFSSEYDTLRTFGGAALTGTLTLDGVNTTNLVTVRGSGGHGILLRGSRNFLDVRCDNNAGDGVHVAGGADNVIHLIARSNRANGITLTGGASGNRVFIETGVRSNTTVVPGTGNLGHGVLLSEDARDNTIQARGVVPSQVGASANTGDGVRLEGAGVINNVLSNGFASANGGHGVIVTGGASNNVIKVNANANRRSGIALVSGAGGPPVRTRVNASCSDNADYGILISGVSGDGADPAVNPFTIFVQGSDNLTAGVRLENVVTGLRCGFDFFGGPVGMIVDGRGVTGNSLSVEAFNCAEDGVRLLDAENNDLSITILGCLGHGMVVTGADNNRLSVRSTFNGGDGLVLTGGSQRNRVSGFLNFNANGVTVRGGAHHNVLDDLLLARNSGHGLLLEGPGTASNQLRGAQIGLCDLGGGNDGDGIRIQAGASDNRIGTPPGPGLTIQNSLGAGIRIAGTGTRGNQVRSAVISFPEETAPLFRAAGGGGGCQGTRQAAGIIVEDGAEQTLIGGADALEGNIITGNKRGIVIRNGARDVVIQRNLIASNVTHGVLVDGASDVAIGGEDPAGRNELFEQEIGVQLQGATTTNCFVAGNRLFAHSDAAIVVRDAARGNLIRQGNEIFANQAGVRFHGAGGNHVLENAIRDHLAAGVRFESGAADNLVARNRITGNAAGVEVDGADSLRNTIQNNSITANAGKGIRLTGGGNREIASPAITALGAGLVSGTAAAPNGSVVELFQDPADEGEIFIAHGRVYDGRFAAEAALPAGHTGAFFHLNATVTDPDGNTSEFGGSGGDLSTAPV